MQNKKSRISSKNINNDYSKKTYHGHKDDAKQHSSPYRKSKNYQQPEEKTENEAKNYFQEDSDKEREEQSLLPGIKPVHELLESSPERIDIVYVRKGRHGQEMDNILDVCRSMRVRFSLLDSSSFARIYSGKSQGVIARLYKAGFIDPEDLFSQVMDAPLPLVVALDQVQDPGNAGTLARTLYALGGAGLLIPKHNGVYLGAAAAKSSAGALEKLPVARASNMGQTIETAKKNGFTIYGTKSSSNQQDVTNIFSLKPRFPAILILGNEEKGIRPNVEKRCEAIIEIPLLRNFDSLNVAQAGAIIIGQFLQYSIK